MSETSQGTQGVWHRAERLAGWLFAMIGLGVASCRSPSPSATEINRQALAGAQVPRAWVSNENRTEVTVGWITQFGDARLEALVQEAMEHNPDVRASTARVAAAAGRVKAAGARLYPSVKALGRIGVGLGGDLSGLSGGLVSASWEIDLWGRVAAGRAAATAAGSAAVADHRSARQSLAAAVAKSWFVATETQTQEVLFTSLWHDAEELVRLVEVRRRVGKATDRDLALTRAEASSSRDRLLEVQQANIEARRALEILLGRYPAATQYAGSDLAPTLAVVPAGLPAQLLERRPDVVASRLRLVAAFHRVEEAKAARFPSFSLTAAFGTVSSDLIELKTGSPWLLSGGASLLAPIFLGGELQAQVELRTAEQEQALAEYAAVVLGAFAEVENALTAEQILRERQPILEQAVEEHARALASISVEYEVGKVDLLSLLQERQKLTTSRSTLLRLKSERLVGRVQLHLALGGDFETTE